MKIVRLYFLVADGNEKGMPLDGPFYTEDDLKDYAKSEYGCTDKELGEAHDAVD